MLFGGLGLEQQKRQGQPDSSHVSAQIRWQISSLRGPLKKTCQKQGKIPVRTENQAVLAKEEGITTVLWLK